MSDNKFYRHSHVRSGVLLRQTRLNLERLEERALLSAVGWGGFDPNPDVNLYSIETSEISIDFSANKNLGLVGISDFNGDGQNDIVAVNNADSSPELTVFFGKGDGTFETAKTTALTTGSTGAESLLADMTGDGKLDFITISQNNSDNSILDVKVYGYQSGGLFSLTRSSEISLNVFGNYALYVASTVYAAQVGNDLAIQLQNCYGLDASGNSHSLEGTVVCQNDGTGAFSSPQTVTSFSGTAVGSVRVAGTDYLVSLNKESRVFGFWSYSASKNTWSNAGSINYVGVAGSADIRSVAASGSHLYFCGNLAGVTAVYDLSLSVSGGGVVLASSQSNPLGRYFTGEPVMAFGDVNSDHLDDLLIASGSNYTALLGAADGTFSEVGTTITQTDYLASCVVDLDGDGKEDILTVGAYGVWGINGADFDADPVNYGTFDYAVSEAVFGDFDADGKIDIAVLEAGSRIVSIYGNLGGTYNRIKIIESPTTTVNGAITTAAASHLVMGHFTQTARDELMVHYTWLTNTPDRFCFYDSSFDKPKAQLFLSSGETVTALTVGDVFGNGYCDIVACVESGPNLNLILWKNNAGLFTQKSPVTVSSSADRNITALAVGDINGDEDGDIVLLNAGKETETGLVTGAGLGWILQAANDFPVSTLHWDEAISASGTLDGLLLADVTGDGALDLFTTLSEVDGDGTSRSSVYMAKGDLSENAVSFMGKLTNYPLAGDYASGIHFDGGSLIGPSLTLWENAATELGDVVMVKGKSVVVLRSLEGGGGNEGFLYLVHSAASAKPTAVLTDPDNLGSDYYGWIDEWSRFYVEIWGTADGNAIFSFTTALAFQTDYYVFESFESGDGFTVSTTLGNGVVNVSGSASTAVAVGAGEYLLLARLLFSPSLEAGAGVAIPEDGSFAAFDAGLSAQSSEESMNGSRGADSRTSALDDLNLFSVRFDSNDDRNVNVEDFILFANNYGYGTAERPFRNPKAATFKVSVGEGLNVQDFIPFANSYGMIPDKITERFYDRIKVDPTAWIAAAALPRDAVFESAFDDASVLMAEDVLSDGALFEDKAAEISAAAVPFVTLNETDRNRDVPADRAIEFLIGQSGAESDEILDDGDPLEGDVSGDSELTVFIPAQRPSEKNESDKNDEIEINL